MSIYHSSHHYLRRRLGLGGLLLGRSTAVFPEELPPFTMPGYHQPAASECLPQLSTEMAVLPKQWQMIL